MSEIYLIKLESGPASVKEPVEAEHALTLNRNVWIWGLESPVSDLDLPDRGDIAIFHDSNQELVGVGEIGDSSNSNALTSYFDQIAGEGYSDVAHVITFLNYQNINGWEPGWMMDLFDISESDAPAQWIENIPDIYKVPQERFAGAEKNIRLILGRLPIDASKFGSLPPDGNGDPQEPERGFSPGDGDGELDSVDWTGPLLAQQYTSRDTLQEAAKGSVQIIILLFGIMIASLSFIRRSSPQIQDTTSETLSITVPLVAGLVGIGIATLVSAFLLTVTAARPRPFSSQIAKKQNQILMYIESTTDINEKSELLRDFSTYYHTEIQELQKWNSIIGASIGGTIGIAIASLALFGYETIAQIFPIYSGYWVCIIVFCIIALALVPLGYIFADTKIMDEIL